jgi:hypothetical protein
MNAFKWFVSAMMIIILVALLVGFVYLQNEINEIKNPNPSTSTSGSSSNGSSSPQSNSTTLVTDSNTTTTTYGGTTLVCTWGTGNDGFILIGNDSSNIININYLNITNVGTATAYVSGYRIQAYYANGAQAFDTTIRIDAAGVYSAMPTPAYVPFTLSSGQSMSGNVFDGRATDQHINQIGWENAFATYTITPVWSSTPPT